MPFQPKTLDYKLSPYTGLTRQSWIEAGEYLLEGIFRNIKHFEDPVVMPRKETKVTYPHSADAVWEFKAEYFEGLARSFFIVAPLIHDNPDIQAAGYKLRDYYRMHVLRSCTKGDPLCVGYYEELQALSGDKTRPFQQTVETCALVICLWICKEQIWDTYTKEEKDTIAAFLTGFANGNTVPQNWRLFNMLDMAFLYMEGYPIDEDIMRNHAQAILAYYAGDGWYRDGHSFDYYSCWAFNVYGPFWNKWYGYEKEPYIAGKFEEYSNRLVETYGDFFDADGWTNMWGRSNIYRNAAASPLESNFMLKNPAADPGLARRISSGSLLQFLTRDDFLFKGVPTLGFYGQFTPLVQGYSCAESPFWLGKAFLCLHLPKDHPFWTAKENNGTWETLQDGQVKETCLNGPALCFSNHHANGETILRTGKVVKNVMDEHGMWNYGKLCYNTKYPWEAKPTGTGEEEKQAAPYIEAQQYVLFDTVSGELEKTNVTFWSRRKEGVLYRRQFFNYRLNEECHWFQAVNLADFAVPYGIMRADRLRLFRNTVVITLGGYGFPDNETEIIRREKGGAKAIILKGRDHTGREKQMAMTVLCGFDDLRLIHSEGTNPDSERSIIPYGILSRDRQYGYEPFMLVSQVITKESHEDFADEDIFPIEEISYQDPQACGGYGPVSLKLKDGSRHIVDFEGTEGQLLL
ncbi:MAG: DUF2264 domain-containing protein [Parasporobacterium sp.]|nr:DUF2264 domain-containing protein [Parasporobacterium sp.]